MAVATKDPKWIATRREPKRMHAPQLEMRSVGGGGTLASLFGMRMNYRTQETVDKPYAQSGWVHACLKPQGQALAQIAGVLWDSDPQKNRKAKPIDPDKDELAATFARPNSMHTSSQFFEAGILHRRLDGADYWLQLGADDQHIKRIGETPVRLVAVRGKCVQYQADKRGWPIQYRISYVGGTTDTVPKFALVPFRDYDPDNPFGGLADIDVALPDIDLEWQAYRYQRGIIEHSGDPGGWIEGLENLAPEERDAAEKEIEEEFTVVNAGRIRALKKGYKYNPNKLSPRDMEFRQLLEWIRNKIASITGVPLPIIGVLDRATFSNYEQAVELFWKGGNGILGYVRSLEDVINNHFLRQLSDPRQKTYVFRFDTSSVEALQEDRNAKLELAARLLALRVGYSKTEVYKAIGIELDEKDVDHGDVHLVAIGSTTMERVLAEPAPDATPPKDTAPAKDAGKTTEPIARDSAAEAVAAAYEERTAFWKAKEAAYLRKARTLLANAYKPLRQRYEKAQRDKVRNFGAKAAAPRGKALDDDGRLDPAHLEPADVEPLLVSFDEWRSKMDTAFREKLRKIFVWALEDAQDELGGDFTAPSDPKVLAFVSEQVIQLSEGHMSVLAERVRAALLEGLSKATNIGTLQELVAEVLPDIEDALTGKFADKESRALMIARTETAHASNGARYMEMLAAGIEEAQWVSSRDENVRGTPGGPYADSEFSHAELDGTTAKLGEDFGGGNHTGLKHPSDPDADAGDVINCRCLTRAVIKPSSQQEHVGTGQAA